MTREEKVEVMKDWCNDRACFRDSCPLNSSKSLWCLHHDMSGVESFEDLTEAELDEALKLCGLAEEEAPTPEAPAIENDPVNHPNHYTFGGVECIDAIKAATGEGFKAFLQGQVLKYIWRFQHKIAPLEDLKKCRWYLDKLIGVLETEDGE